MYIRKNNKFRNINEDEMRFSMIGHEKNINSLHFSTDDRYLVSTADDGTLKIWDVSIGQEIFTFKYDVSQINYAEFNYDGRKIITAMSDGMIKVLKFTPFQEIVDSVRIYFKNYPLTLEERKQFFLE